ncbi:NIPSNAP family containing protein [bacterium SCGC AG-212-C10]|nr:NIPSNAP family containing protein [bacterium SCGC AG-212-C10]
MFFELRQYTIRPGTQAAFVELMEEKIIPFQIAQGMTILGSFVGETDETTFVWIRRFASEEARAEQYKRVYESDYWRDEISPPVLEMLVREEIKVTRLVATPRSVIQ